MNSLRSSGPQYHSVASADDQEEETLSALRSPAGTDLGSYDDGDGDGTAWLQRGQSGKGNGGEARQGKALRGAWHARTGLLGGDEVLMAT